MLSLPKGDQSDIYGRMNYISRSTGSIRESYNIVRTLGSGSLGTVFLVKDKRSGLERVAKELIKFLVDEYSIENFIAELTTLRALVSIK